MPLEKVLGTWQSQSIVNHTMSSDTDTFGVLAYLHCWFVRYRSILTNILFKLPATWGALFAEERTNGFLPRIFEIGTKVVTSIKADSGRPTHGEIVDCRHGTVFVEGIEGGSDVGKGPPWLSVPDLIKLNKAKLDAGVCVSVCVRCLCANQTN